MATTWKKYANNAHTTLDGGITDVATSLTVDSETSFPAVQFYISVHEGNYDAAEIMLVTNVAGTSFTVTRGHQGTSGTAWGDGAYVQLLWTKGDVEELQTAITALETGTATIDGLKCDGPAVFNESGADVDFRVEGVGAANALFVQGSDGFVGVGNAAPTRKLNVLDASNPQLRLTKTAGSDYWDFLASGNSLTLTSANTASTQINLGVADTVRGAILLFGHATGTAQGGTVREYTSADYDTTIDFYDIKVNEDDFQIGPSTDTDSLIYYGGTGIWTFTGTGMAVNGNTTLGDAQGDLTTINGSAKILTGAVEAKSAIELSQTDTDQPFIKFTGTSGASSANSLSSWTTGGAIQGFARVNINGTDRWMPFYTAPTS